MSREPVHLTATPSQTVGPFFHFGLADNPTLGRMAPPGIAGTPIRLRIEVTDGDFVPVPDALIELWQADAAGRYSTTDDDPPAAFSGFGRLPTNGEGTCVFETILPGRVPDGSGGLQAAHINVCLFSRGLLRQIYTRIYFAGEPGLDDDPILKLVPEERRRTLLAQRRAAGEWTFDIRLQGDGETVFFDL
jgi:protocatechuate 3,4-dioxygenase, alpha subunit